MNIEEQIEMTLDKIRPFIQRDGGDVTFDSFEDGIVYLNFLGACEGCSMIGETLSSGAFTSSGFFSPRLHAIPEL